MRKPILMSLMFLMVITGIIFHRSTAQVKYYPKAVFCAILSNNMCSFVPANIGPDPSLRGGFGYPGLFKPFPISAAQDVQTPFDNMAWQMFVGLNWAASAVKQTPATGLTMKGTRVWQKYRKVSSLFGNSPVRANCTNALALPIFYIGSDGNGNPMPNNEEYFQASTNKPLIDINGNWTIFERRVNDVEARYLLAPNGNASQTLTTKTGQNNFIASNPKGASFTPSSIGPIGKTGSIEIKAAWRILDKNAGDDPSRYYTQLAIIAVPGDLVNGGKQFCASVTLGLVGMHIIQRNPVDPNKPELLPQWIWATFEHMDNAPPAQTPCDVTKGCPDPKYLTQSSCGPVAASFNTRYSYYRNVLGGQDGNITPMPAGSGNTSFPWNPTRPYAQGATTPTTAQPQATRCWSIFQTTADINTQWQNALGKFNTPFKNYQLIGTQWGGAVEVPAHIKLPGNAVPAMLSNMTLETYIQNYTTATQNGGPGSCVGCHSGATLAVGNNVPSDFSFLPGLAEPGTARSKIKTAR